MQASIISQFNTPIYEYRNTSMIWIRVIIPRRLFLRVGELQRGQSIGIGPQRYLLRPLDCIRHVTLGALYMQYGSASFYVLLSVRSLCA